MGCCVGGVRFGHGDRDASFFARNDLFALVVSFVGNRFDLIARHHLPCRARHHRQGITVVSEVRHLVRNDQMMFRLDSALDAVAADAALPACRCH
jgi:hypothetical protein